ncbi:MAG: trigger factor [Deltaproteobacteria bacterium]|nr:trigger factor [Deltaproteobacteria bacterium]
MMKATLEDVSSVKKKLFVEIDADDVDKKIEETFKRFGKNAKIKGFRPGKIPRKILENYFGSQVLTDVTDSLIRETLPRAIEETKTFPLEMPVVDNEIVKTGENYSYSATMEVKPEFELKEFLGIKAEKEICSVTDDHVSDHLNRIREASGTLVSVSEENRGVKEGDFAVIDYAAYDSGNAIETVKGNNVSIKIGGKDFYPGIEDALIGKKKGSQTETRVDFEADHRDSRLAGKSIDFKVKLVDIKELILPELNDEFVKDLGGEFKTLDELKEKIKKDLVRREEARIDKELKERIVKKISEKVDFELPECLVAAEINAAVENVKQNLRRSGSTLESAGIDELALKEQFRPMAEDMVKDMFILGTIARQNELKISSEDEIKAFEEMGSAYGQSPEVLRKYYEANNLMDSLRESLLKEKTLNFLVENAKIEEIAADKLNKVN